MDNLIGKKLGQYEIREKVGQGGMAQVYKAYHAGLDRFVAVKILSLSLAENHDFSERFQREALSIAKLNHPNILAVYDAGIQDKYHYMVMRYVEKSVTLDDLIQAGANIDQLIHYVVQVAEALHYAHAQGIIHRDIKPSNILIDGKWALLADFGLVKISEDSSELTSTGLTMGTPAYMSPEQAQGKHVDQRTDIYALGIILYKILTGTVPHQAPTPLAIAIKRSTEPIPPLHLTNPYIPLELERIIRKTLEIKPEDRYHTAAQFAQELQLVKIDPEGTLVQPNLRTQGGLRSTVVPNDEATMASQGRLKSQSDLPTKKQPSYVMGGAAVVVVMLLLGGLFFFSRSAVVPPTVAPSPTLVSSLNIPMTVFNTPSPAPDAGPPRAMAQIDLDIYAGPSEVYDVVGGLPQGNQVEIIGRTKAADWWQVKLPTGIGWIKAAPELVAASHVDNILIAVAPPIPTLTVTPTPLSTDTPTPLPATDTPTPSPATDTPTPSPATATRSAGPSPTKTASPPTPLPDGQFRLLKPNSVQESVTGMAAFEWQWTSPLLPNQGFEIRIWQGNEAPRGVHDAVNDNKNGRIVALPNNTYRLETNISQVGGIDTPSGDYNWTVLLIQLDPYKELGLQAQSPNILRYAAPGPSGGGGSSGGGSSGGGGGGGPR